MVRRVQKLVPAFELPQSVRFNEALLRGRRAAFTPVDAGPDGVAVLQHTGGTTIYRRHHRGEQGGGIAASQYRGQRLVAGGLGETQARKTIPASEQPTTVCALPLHHIFVFTYDPGVGY